MNVSKTVILTLAALSSQNLTAQAKALLILIHTLRQLHQKISSLINLLILGVCLLLNQLLVQKHY